jgi:hypothetical protein
MGVDASDFKAQRGVSMNNKAWKKRTLRMFKEQPRLKALYYNDLHRKLPILELDCKEYLWIAPE